MTGWAVVDRRGSAQALHDLTVADPARREVWVCRPTAPALVLGSTQPADVVDERALAGAGVELARRRSGGGAVLLDPDDLLLWVDVVLPRGDRLWSDDVGRASHWVGEAWAEAWRSTGGPAEVHRGGLVRRPWSDLVCFAGLGPGEVIAGGAKVVGLSQRRTAPGARFQTLVLRRWSPDRTLALLRLDPARRHAGEDDLRGVAGGTDASEDEVLDAFAAALPR